MKTYYFSACPSDRWNSEFFDLLNLQLPYLTPATISSSILKCYEFGTNVAE